MIINIDNDKMFFCLFVFFFNHTFGENQLVNDWCEQRWGAILTKNAVFLITLFCRVHHSKIWQQ